MVWRDPGIVGHFISGKLASQVSKGNARTKSFAKSVDDDDDNEESICIAAGGRWHWARTSLLYIGSPRPEEEITRGVIQMFSPCVSASLGTIMIKVSRRRCRLLVRALS